MNSVPVPPPDSPLWHNGDALLAWMLLTIPPKPEVTAHIHEGNWFAQDESAHWYIYIVKPEIDIETDTLLGGTWISHSANWWSIGYMPCHLDWKDTLYKLNKED